MENTLLTIYHDLENRLIFEFKSYIEDSNDYKFNKTSKIDISDLDKHYSICDWLCREISKIRETIPKANLHMAAIWNEYKQKALIELNGN